MSRNVSLILASASPQRQTIFRAFGEDGRGDVWNVVGFPARRFLAHAAQLGIPDLDPSRALAALDGMEPTWPGKR